MKKAIFALFIAVLGLGLGIGDAEAKRLGGGKSSGVQRDTAAPKPATPPAQNAATPAAAPQAAPAPAAAPKRSWMGPLAGLAAGLGIAALLSHFGLGEGVANFLMIGLLVLAAVFIFKMLFRKKDAGAPANEPLQYAGAGNVQTPPPPVAVGSSAPLAANPKRIPDGFDSEGFLRVAKLNFIRLQAANDAGNLEDLRQFVSPELLAEIKLQLAERGAAKQHTDVISLNGELLELVTEGGQHIASVHFSGMIREEEGAVAAPFAEIWHLSKPLSGESGWTVCGIQQTA